MTKKDFELIADALAKTRPADNDGSDCANQWEHDACVLADALATTNDKFDRARFLAACGVSS